MVAAYPLHRAAELLRKNPLCFSNHQGKSSDCGFFGDPRECIEALSLICGVEPTEGTAFAHPWPFLEYEGHILAPALPVPVSTTEVLGPDGGYQRIGSTIERESAGCVEPFLDLKSDRTSGFDQPTAVFDLLWFSDNERFILDGSALRISSLFAEFTLPAGRGVLDRMLRFLDLGGDVLAAWNPPKEIDQPATVRMGKSLALVDEDRWEDPEAYLSRRPEVKDVDSSASALVVTAIDDERAVYQNRFTESGWILDLVEGRSLYPQLDVRKTDETLILKAQIDSSLDAARSDVRARVAFDLTADFQNS